MPTAVQFRRGTTAQHATFTGANGEVTVDTDKKTVVVHDGSTAGGVALAKESALSAYVQTSAIGSTVQGYDADTAKLDNTQTFTAPQTFSAGASDASGSFRKLPQNAQTSSYTIVAGDTGKHISITTGGVTIPSGVMSVGDVVTIFNNSTSSQTITQASGVTLRKANGTDTGNRTLSAYGLATVLCVGSNVFVISGVGLT
jgi:hypothetical protein